MSSIRSAPLSKCRNQTKDRKKATKLFPCRVTVPCTYAPSTLYAFRHSNQIGQRCIIDGSTSRLVREVNGKRMISLLLTSSVFRKRNELLRHCCAESNGPAVNHAQVIVPKFDRRYLWCCSRSYYSDVFPLCVRRNVNFRPPSFFFSLFAFVRPLDRRIELGQIKENDSRGVTTLLSVTNTSVLFLRVRPYRSGRMNGPGQFRLKQAGEKKKPRVSRFCLQKIFLPFDYDGNWVQGRAKRKWAAPSRPCIPAVKRDASAVPYAVPREKKKEAEGLVPFLHLVRFGSLQGIARL